MLVQIQPNSLDNPKISNFKRLDISVSAESVFKALKEVKKQPFLKLNFYRKKNI